MKDYRFELSENGWEYIGDITITASKVERVDKKTLIADGVKIQFDEEINGFTDNEAVE